MYYKVYRYVVCSTQYMTMIIVYLVVHRKYRKNCILYATWYMVLLPVYYVVYKK